MKEELKGKQHKLDKNKNGKLDAHDFKLLRKENNDEKEEEQETSDYKTDKNGKKYKAHKIVFNKGEDDGKRSLGEEQMDEKEMTDAQMKKREDIVKGMKKSFKDFKDRYGARAKDVMYATATKQAMKEDAEELDELSKELLARYAKSATVDARMKHGIGKDFEYHAAKSRKPEYKAGAKEWENKYKSDARKRQAGVHKAIDRLAKEEVEELDELSKDTLTKYNTRAKFSSDPKHREGAEKAQSKMDDLTYGWKKSADGKPKNIAKKLAKTGMKAQMNKEEVELDEAMWPGTPEYNKKYKNDRFTGAGARHDVTKTATGVRATRRYNPDGETEAEPNQPKRGRGRPKKNKFAEAADFLLNLTDEDFDSVMEEGFDAFFEAYSREINK